MTGKLLLSHLPVGYSTWRALGVFRHGSMHQSFYALAVFMRHFESVASRLPPGFVVVELGPGDSIATAVIARAYGAGTTYLVDVGRYASWEMAPYRELGIALAAQGRPVPELDQARSVDELLEAVGAHYLTEGHRSLMSLPQSCADLVFSQAVLEHIPLTEFSELISALLRVQKVGGFGSHRIDFKDHLGESLHSLRFSPRIWETWLVRSSGFYTNRLRISQVVQIFQDAGFVVVRRREERWPEIPLPRRAMHPTFAHLDDDDFLISGVDLLVRRRDQETTSAMSDYT